jgi:small GTP-binding protein
MSADAPSAKIVFLGETGCGKTSLITRYVDNSFGAGAASTVAAASRTVRYDHRGVAIDLVLWDTAGQERYRALTPIYYRNAIAAVIVFDVTSRETFEHVQGWINELLSNVGDIVIVICANKQDLESKRVVQTNEGEALATIAQSIFCETSAMTGYGVDYLFQMVVRRIEEERPGLFRRDRLAAIEVENKGAEQETYCC